MSKFITFNGVTLFHPGGITKVDATGMAQVAGGASGIVGVIGEADYGEPYDPIGGSPKVYTFTDPDAAAETFKSGPLADSIDFLFNPANDVRIPGGTQQLIAIKSNIDTQSTTGSTTPAAVPNQVLDAVSLTFTSVIYGQYANALSVAVARNEANTDTLDVTVTDGNTDTVETFTQICGNPLLDVQYAPSTPTQIGAEVATNALSAADTLVVAAASVAQVGQYVQITEASAAQAFLVGQVRRVTVAAGVTITVSGPWVDAAGATVAGADRPAAATKFIVIREAVGPFDVATYNATQFVITGTSVPGAVPTGPSFSVLTGATGADYYGDPTNGPCYVHVVSGTGEGQIRRIATAAEIAAGGYTLADGLVSGTPALGYSIQLSTGFATELDATSKFVFINAVPLITSPTFTGSVMTGEGAVGVIAGSAGGSTSITLSARPGYGEATGAGAWVAAGAAGALRTGGDWVFTLSDTLNVNALVTAINNSNVIAGATKNAATSTGAWKARVGLGRDPAAFTNRFDFTGKANGADGASTGVDCLCGFNADHPAAAETGDFGSTPNRYHRFTDNLMLLVDTCNAQSVLVSAVRGPLGTGTAPTGANFGDGVPAFATYALGGGAYNATTAAGLAACFNELIKHRHDTAIALWSVNTPTFTLDYVHSLLLQHSQNGAGSYNNEIDCIAAFQPPAGGTEDAVMTLIENKSAFLNNRNVALVFQDIKRTGLTGTVNQYEPHMLACAVAGMQAGSAVGTPLTFKIVQAVEVLCNNTRIDSLDKNTSDLLLQRGLLFTEKVKGKGFRIVKNISTYIATDNVAYTDRNVNYELNYIAYDLRTFIVDRFVGEKGTPAVVAAVKSSVITKLEYYKTNIEIIVDSQDPTTGQTLNAYRNIKVTISGDICTIRFEIFPAVGINYVTFEIFAKLPTLSA